MRQDRGMWQLLTALVAMTLVLAACGGEEDGAADDGETETETGTDTDADSETETESGDTDDGQAAATTEPQTYDLGLAMPLSGPQASLGQDFVRFVEFGVEGVNEQYAEQGIQLNLVTEDTQGAAEIGVNALNKLASVDDVPVVLTAWSSVVQAMASVSEDLGVAVINIGANDPNLAGVSDNLANMFPLSTVDVGALAEYMVTEREKERAAIIYVDNATGEGAAEHYREVFEAAGGEVVAMESIRQDAVDASTQVAQVAAANPDTVHIQPLLTEAPVILNELASQGLEATVTSYSGVGEASAVRESAGSAMGGLIYTSLVAGEDSPILTEQVAAFADSEGRDPAGISYLVYMYDGAFLYAETIQYLREQGREVTGESVLDVIREVKTFQLPILGEITFDDNLTVSLPVELLEVSDASSPSSEDNSIATLAPE